MPAEESRNSAYFQGATLAGKVWQARPATGKEEALTGLPGVPLRNQGANAPPPSMSLLDLSR